jgi:hypothetical protein
LTVSGTGIATWSTDLLGRGNDGLDLPRGDERPRRVVNDDHVVSGDAARLEGQANGFGTRRSAGDDLSFPGDPGNLFDPVRRRGDHHTGKGNPRKRLQRPGKKRPAAKGNERLRLRPPQPTP